MWSIDVKETLTPVFKKTKIRVKTKTRLIKDVDDKYTKLFKPNDKIIEFLEIL